MRIYWSTTARPCDGELQSSLCCSWRAACVYKVGAFESEALRVPEHCQFDHIHDSSECRTYDAWNVSTAEACHVRPGYDGYE